VTSGVPDYRPASFHLIYLTDPRVCWPTAGVLAGDSSKLTVEPWGALFVADKRYLKVVIFL
jgi:hypothetical protein